MALASRALVAAAVVFLAYIQVGELRKHPTGYWAHWGNDPFWAEMHGTSRRVLAASEVPGVQIRAGRPLVVWTEEIGGLPYAPSTIDATAPAFRELYGVDVWGKASWVAGCALRTGSERSLWESFSPDDWRQLAARYSFERVVAPADWALRLPEEHKGTSVYGGAAVASYVVSAD